MPVNALAPVVAPVMIQLNEDTKQLSATVGFVVTTEDTQVPAPTFNVTFDAHAIVGLMLSFRVTLNVQVDELLLSSVAVMVTICTVPWPEITVPAAGD